jgi:hypothetical protein
MWQTENRGAAIHGKLKIAEMRNVENVKTAGIQHVANLKQVRKIGNSQDEATSMMKKWQITNH